MCAVQYVLPNDKLSDVKQLYAFTHGRQVVERSASIRRPS